MKKYLLLAVFLVGGFFLLLLSPAKANAGCCTAVDCGADNTCSGPVFDDSGACVTQGTCQYAGGNDCGYCTGSGTGAWCQGWSVGANQSCGSTSTGCDGCGGGGGTAPTSTPTPTLTPTPTPMSTLPSAGSSTPIVCGNTCRKDGWTGPISITAIGLPSGSSGSIRAQADFVYVDTTETYPSVTPAAYKQYLRQTIVRGNNSYIRTVPLDSTGAPLWGSAGSWSGPYGIPPFCSGQQIQTLDYQLEGTAPNKTLVKSLWCNDKGFMYKVKFVNGQETDVIKPWNTLEPAPTPTTAPYAVSGSWPSGSSGELQGQADYKIGEKIYKNLWRGDQGWSNDYRPNASGVWGWTGWSIKARLSDLPGSGDTLQVVQNTYFPNNTLMQSFWRGDQGWVRSIPVNADGDPVWGQAYNSVCESGNTCSGGACKLDACVDLPCACTAKTYTKVNYMNPQTTPIPRNVCQASWECGTAASGAYNSCEYASSYFAENTSAGLIVPVLPFDKTYNCSGAYTYGISDIVQVTPVPASGYESNTITGGKYRGWANWFGLQTLNIVLTSPTPTPIPPTATPTPGSPSISNLQIGNVRPTGTSTYRIAGNQSGQGGANWYNPMNITINVARGASWSGTPTPVSAAYVAMYDDALTKVTAKASLVSTVQGYLRADPSKGVLLGYGSGVAGGASTDHLVFDPINNRWINIDSLVKKEYPVICGATTKIRGEDCLNGTKLYTIEPNGTNSWRVAFDKSFGSKNLYTAVYAKDSNDKDAFNADITPVDPPTPTP